MIQAHILGFPRIGADRELKKAVEAYWKRQSSQDALQATGRALRQRHWALQRAAGLDFVVAGDFTWYDHMLDMSAMLGVVPPRFGWKGGDVDLDTYFRMARGTAPTGEPAFACEMTKWFDTNYHYIVPEFQAGQSFRLASSRLFDEVGEAQGLGFTVKPVLVGPLTYLWLGKVKGAGGDRLALLDRLIPVYREILLRLKKQGVEWVQIDEPALALDLPKPWLDAFARAYEGLKDTVKLLVATYFEGVGDRTEVIKQMPVAGWHVDLVRAPDQLPRVAASLRPEQLLSVGVIDGRNIWRADLDAAVKKVEEAKRHFSGALAVSASCSLLHVPVDLGREAALDAEMRSWLAFAVQKLDEIQTVRRAVAEGPKAVESALATARAALEARRTSKRIHNPAVKQRMATLTEGDARRQSVFATRRAVQQKQLGLPAYPTTTIGSFPQTSEIRTARRDFKAGKIGEAAYNEKMRGEIELAVRKQEEVGIDVLVHGEAERNDMVEYFGEQLNGFVFTQYGWVQSYGSRCVKPPVIFGDVSRPSAMTVEWAKYAQSLTSKPMKGMLTGPVTILQWSFVRDDQPRSETCMQIALAIRDEVKDLERAGIRVIQIDEPAVREGLPLRESNRATYLDWAVRAFKVASSPVEDATQIHTHMCYAEFNDIIDAVAAMDADVITIETSRSDMELLDAFVNFRYPNEIGPGVYDIHSPRIPKTDEMVRLLRKASQVLPAEHLWVNPDCGLKTRSWPEVEEALRNMVEAARILRESQAA